MGTNGFRLMFEHGDKAALVHFWNRSLSSVSRDSEVEELLAELMKEIRRYGDGEISANLREASNRSVGMAVAGSAHPAPSVRQRPYVKILAAPGYYDYIGTQGSHGACEGKHTPLGSASSPV